MRLDAHPDVCNACKNVWLTKGFPSVSEFHSLGGINSRESNTSTTVSKCPSSPVARLLYAGHHLFGN